MAVGVVQANLNDVCAGIADRVAIMGVKVAERPMVQVNLGQAQGISGRLGRQCNWPQDREDPPQEAHGVGCSRSHSAMKTE